MSAAELTIVIGESDILEAVVSPSEKLSSIQWQSGDPGIALCSEADPSSADASAVLITGKSIGSTTVIAVIDNIIERCRVDIIAKAATGIYLDKTALELNVGDEETLTATIEPEDVTYPSVSWSSDNEAVATVTSGKVKALSQGKAVIMAKSGDMTATCEVNVSNVDIESLTLDIESKELSVNETIMLTAVIAPSNTTFKTVEWSSDNPGIATVECIDGSPDDDIVNGRVTAFSEGTAVITARAGELSARCEIVVKPLEIPLADPKIGDYYYSDGTWSDGGLVSINPDGTSPVWADVKPAPLDGKTVIGIVFSTNPDRMHTVDKENGFTRGYVVCTRSAHAPDRTETMYSFDEGISFMTGIKLGTSWYNNLNGYVETHAALDAYAGKVDQIPAFDWTTTDFSPSAPVGTSGWYLPSTGQLWDMLANLCGTEVAEYLKSLRNYGYDITYVAPPYHHVSYDIIAAFNEKIALVPESQKEELPYTGTDASGKTCEIWCSTLYDNSDGAACMFEIGTNGYIWTGTNWVNSTGCARPILAF